MIFGRSRSWRCALRGGRESLPGPGMEFVKGNFGTFKHDMKREEGLGVVPAQWSTTAQMKDPLPTKALRVKSGYTGHVPHGRDHIGHSFKSIDNPGPPGKPLMEVMHRVYDPTPGHLGYAIRLEPPPKDAALYHDPFHGEHNPFNAKRSGSKQYEYGVATTAPVPMRIEKVLSGDERDMDDEANRQSTLDMDGEGQWVMAGYTGHVPKAREVYGTSYYGPPEGPSYKGPFYTSDVYANPGGPNREAICP